MTRKATDSRPKIWSEGRQHPKLDAKSFALASVAFAREGLSGLLGRCSASARTVAERTAPEAAAKDNRLSRLAGQMGSLLDHAASWVGGQAGTAPETIFSARPAAPEPVAVARTEAGPPAHRVPLDPDLVLLRSVIANVRDGGPKAAEMTPDERRAEAAEQARVEAEASAHRRGLRLLVPGRLFGAALGFGLLVVSVPYGAVRAILAHLDGQDLRREV